MTKPRNTIKYRFLYYSGDRGLYIQKAVPRAAKFLATEDYIVYTGARQVSGWGESGGTGKVLKAVGSSGISISWDYILFI